MVKYKRSIKAQLSTIFCIGICIALSSVITFMIVYTSNVLKEWMAMTGDRITFV